MSPAQQRGLALWASLLSALVCLLFLPVPRWGAWLILLVTLALIIGIWRIASRRTGRNVASTQAPLPEGAYRQPVVLVCGDLPCVWPPASPVRVVKQGCWIRVKKTEELQQVARQVLSQRPEWGPQLSVLLCVCPQRHAQSDALTSALLALRWQLSQLRQQTGYAVPLALQGQVGSAMSRDLLWQAAIPGEAVKVWQPSCAPCSVPAWVRAGGAAALEQQVLMNSLMDWSEQHVHAVLTEENTDLPPLTPAAVLWGLGPSLPGSLASSAWTTWLSRHSGLSRVAGWQPDESDTGALQLCRNSSCRSYRRDGDSRHEAGPGARRSRFSPSRLSPRCSAVAGTIDNCCSALASILRVMSGLRWMIIDQKPALSGCCVKMPRCLIAGRVTASRCA